MNDQNNGKPPSAITAALLAAEPQEPAERLRIEVQRLARLDEAGYEAERKQAAHALDVPATRLDALVKAARIRSATTKRAGVPPMFPAVVLHHESQNGAKLLDDVRSTLRRFLVLPPGAPELLALWTAYTHAYDVFDVATWITLLSPRERCGKSRTIEVVAPLTPRAFVTSGVTAAAYFRIVEEFRPIVFIDEFEQFAENEELRCTLNSGYRRATAYVTRCIKTDGGEISVARFSTFAPLFLAKIGEFDGRWRTIRDRSPIIRMRRRTAAEPVERFRNAEYQPLAAELRSRLARWTTDHREALAKARPAEIPGLDDRANEIIAPLLAVADIAGGSWPTDARAAIVAIMSSRAEEDDAISTLVLSDIRELFEAENADKLTTKQILDCLNGLAERPWPTWNKGRPLNEHNLGRLLRPFEIKSRTIRLADGTPKGYVRADFVDAWSRYLASEQPFPPNIPPQIRHIATNQRRVGESDDRDSPQKSGCGGSKSEDSPTESGGVAVLRIERGDTGQKHATTASTCRHGGDPNHCVECEYDRLAAADAEGREPAKEPPADDKEKPPF
jgi:hypothetical protein